MFAIRLPEDLEKQTRRARASHRAYAWVFGK